MHIHYINLVLVIAAMIVLWGANISSTLVRLKDKVTLAWGLVANSYKERHNFIPKLIAVTKDYTSADSCTLGDISLLKNQALSAKSPYDIDQSERFLSMEIAKLIALADTHPELKTNVDFKDAEKSLATINNQIQDARQNYNKAANNFNSKIHAFPYQLVAAMLHFSHVEPLK